MIRTVRDIDRATRRKYLYTIPLLRPSTSNEATSTTTAAALTAIETDTIMAEIPPMELPGDIVLRLPSPSGRKIAIFRMGSVSDTTTSSSGSTGQRSWLEIWVGASLQRRVDLSQVGKVVVDAANFGRPSWHSDETAVVLTVQRPPIATTSFFDTLRAGKNDPTDTSAPMRGAQNTLGIGQYEGWGEKYHSQIAPMQDLIIVNVNTGLFGPVTNVPDNHGTIHSTTTTSSAHTTTEIPARTNQGGYSLGQPIFDGPQSIVYTAWDAGGGGEMPRRLGLVYCRQRPCQLYRSNVQELLQKLATPAENNRENKGIPTDSTMPPTPFTSLTRNHQLSHSPRISPDGTKLIFYTNKSGFETHSGCFALGMLETAAFAAGTDSSNCIPEPTIVVDIVEAPLATNQDQPQVVAGLGFAGLYESLPESSFLPSSSDLVLTTTQWGSCQKVVLISLSQGTVRLVQCSSGDETAAAGLSSDSLLCVTPWGDAVMAVQTPQKPAAVHVIPYIELLNGAGSTNPMISKVFANMAPIASTMISPVHSLASEFSFHVRVMEPPRVAGVDFQGQLQSILMVPNKSDNLPAVIVVPHGGPHSAHSTLYMPSYAYLCGHGGYAILLVNYRGSTGQGQTSIQALPTNIGTLDVQDLVAATREVQGSGLVDPHRIGICGGSHGGFLTAHITAQYPDLFRAAVMRNPVVNLASMVTATDIPDWNYVEARGSYHWDVYRPPNKDDLDAFYAKSPIQHIHHVRTPTLVALGMKDLRVPPAQGLEWFHTLRSMGIDCKLLLYENDDHAIEGVASEADHWINVKHWFDKYLN